MDEIESPKVGEEVTFVDLTEDGGAFSSILPVEGQETDERWPEFLCHAVLLAMLTSEDPEYN